MDIGQAGTTNLRTVATCHLGSQPYEPVWRLQQQLQSRLIEEKRATPVRQSRLPNFLLTVEHPPVYTLGKSGQEDHLLLNQEQLRQDGATFYRTDRGGDITYHGPGQLVGYPILDLDRFFTDIGKYLRLLEEVMISVCASYGLEAGRVEGRTGVWVDLASGNERKICALGIRCSRWVTMHGFAFNMNTKLGAYDSIVPCGISDRGVTSLRQELGRTIDEVECRNRVLAAFSAVFDAPLLTIEPKDLDNVTQNVTL